MRWCAKAWQVWVFRKLTVLDKRAGGSWREDLIGMVPMAPWTWVMVEIKSAVVALCSSFKTTGRPLARVDLDATKFSTGLMPR